MCIRDRYVCANEMRHINDYTITTTGDNLNYSRCGIRFGDTGINKYPRLANHWETVECPFSLGAHVLCQKTQFVFKPGAV